MTKTLKKPAGSSLDNMKPLMDERAELHASKKRIEERIKEIDMDLRPSLVGRGPIVYNGYQFQVQERPGRVTYDTKKMLEDGMDLSNYEKVGKPTTVFTVKAVNEL